MRTVTSLLALAFTASCGSPPPPIGFPEAHNVTSSDGVTIRYEVHGLGRPALVFVHGWCCDRTYWKPQVDFFSENHTVVTVDLAGHGQSGCDRRKWSMAAFGADVSAVIRELELDDVILVGHSMGGSVILEAALLLPERVTALVPVDTFFDVESILSREQAEQFLSPFRADFAGTARSYIDDNLFAPETDISLRRAIVTDMSEAPPHIALGSLEELLTYDTPSALRHVHIPIRCINSDKYPTRVDRARRYAPSFDAVFIHSVGHFLMMEKPEEFNRVLSDVVKALAMGEDGYSMPRGT